MSIKSDILMLGAVGVGAYLLIVNADKVGAWLGSTLGKGAADTAAAAAGGAVEAAANIAAVPNTAIALWQYELSLGAQQNWRALQSQYNDAMLAATDRATAIDSYIDYYDARVQALESSPGGLSDAGRAVLEAQKAETLNRVFGIASTPATQLNVPSNILAPPAPAPSYSAVVNAMSPTALPGIRTTAPGDKTGATVFSSTPPAASPNYRPTQAQVVAAVSPTTTPWNQPTLTPAQQYAKTFAMPGSPAWIAAGL